MMLSGGVLNGKRVLGPRVIQFATRNHTADRVDENMGMPMHRGLGPHVRGYNPHHTRLGQHSVPDHLRTRRRRNLLLMGRPRIRRILHLPNQLHGARAVAQREA